MAARRRTGPAGRSLIDFDRALGPDLVGGADEAGRGALAGPRGAAAGRRRPRMAGIDRLLRLDDSKRLRPAVRDELEQEVRSVAEAVAVCVVSASAIDEVGIQAANLTALSRALDGLDAPPHAELLVDGFALAMQSRPHRALVKGDGTSAAIAAASVIAKTTRDRIMERLDADAPGYGFAAHAGYGTAHHREAIARLGPCPAHRRSFAPISRAA
ncbi:MAG: ribonuclease HII [Gaiellales bacterium]